MPFPEEIIADRVLVPGPAGAPVPADYNEMRNRITALEAKVNPPSQIIINARQFGPLSFLGGYDALTSIAMVANRLYAVPFYVASNASFTNPGFEVTVAGAAGTVVRMGVYTPDASGYPSSLIPLGDVDASAVGDRLNANTITVPRGLNWLGGAATADISIKGLVASVGMTAPLGHNDRTGANPRSTFYRTPDLAAGFAELPATFGTRTTVAVTPAFWMQAA